MTRISVTAFVAVIAASVMLLPVTTHSQQPQPVELVWDVAPIGVLADQRLRDAIDQLVDSPTVLRGAGLSGNLAYGGRPGAAQSRRDQAHLLFAAAGFDDPATQLAQQRRCRVWVGVPFLGAAPGSAVKDGLIRAVADGLATLGLRIEPCELTVSPQQADILLWRADQPRPLPQFDSRPQEQSFLIALPRTGQPLAPAGRVGPPVTGDAGLAH